MLQYSSPRAKNTVNYMKMVFDGKLSKKCIFSENVVCDLDLWSHDLGSVIRDMWTS